MWVPVISILWTIMNLMQRTFMTKSVIYTTLNETTGECDQSAECNHVEIITDFTPRPARKHAGDEQSIDFTLNVENEFD
ncbi:unnamed protein product [Xylocopa violacea]|uniref:Secreted protein n=1 Tax=Xylocopa violacea TaxID=135666 RepID=A0ABP1PID3_XYLVO